MKLESGVTDDICLCEWEMGNAPALLPTTRPTMRRTMTVLHPLCPVHTAEGKVLGFFKEMHNAGNVHEATAADESH